MAAGKVRQPISYVIFALSVFFVGFHLYTAFFGVMSGVKHKAAHIGLILLLFYLKECIKPDRKPAYRVLDILLMTAAVSSIVYLFAIDASLDYRSGIVYTADVIFGFCLIIPILEATRRKVGATLCVIIFIFLAYAFLGRYMPSFLKFAGMPVKRFINTMYMSSEGIFGTALYSASVFIVLFIIFGSIMQETGIAKLFTDLSLLAFGRYKGGPAKVAVVASGFFGSISGSAIANVIGTGSFTIPMMKRIGFKPEFAGGVEAAASTGGQIMPPIMGATAFLLAEIVGVGYFEVAKAALIPAILFYVAIGITVHFNAHKNDINGVDPSELPDKKTVLKNLYLLIPLVFLIFSMGWLRLSVSRAGLFTIIITVALVMIKKETRINWERFVKIIEGSVNGMFSVSIACAAVGLIIGTVMATGLGVRMSSILIDLAGGRMIVLLILTMVCSLIMGMGVPTTAAYMMLAALVAPALVNMGVPKMAAHLFIFYYGIISAITPPVALASYAAAGVAKSNPTTTGYHGFKLALSGFILPFMFVFNPVLLMEGAWHQIILALITALLGIICLSGAVERYFIRWHISILESAMLIAAAVLLIDGGYLTDFIGVGCGALVVLYRTLRAKSAVAV